MYNWAVNELACGYAYRERDATLISPEVMFADNVVTILWPRSTTRLEVLENVFSFLSYIIPAASDINVLPAETCIIARALEVWLCRILEYAHGITWSSEELDAASSSPSCTPVIVKDIKCF